MGCFAFLLPFFFLNIANIGFERAFAFFRRFRVRV